jgi:Na+/H+ antiporter NhaD/arsenite permease-like protein
MVELDHHLSISSRLSLNSRILIRMSTNNYRVFFIALFVVVNSLFNKGYQSGWKLEPKSSSK